MTRKSTHDLLAGLGQIQRRWNQQIEVDNTGADMPVYEWPEGWQAGSDLAAWAEASEQALARMGELGALGGDSRQFTAYFESVLADPNDMGERESRELLARARAQREASAVIDRQRAINEAALQTLQDAGIVELERGEVLVKHTGADAGESDADGIWHVGVPIQPLRGFEAIGKTIRIGEWNGYHLELRPLGCGTKYELHQVHTVTGQTYRKFTRPCVDEDTGEMTASTLFAFATVEGFEKATANVSESGHPEVLYFQTGVHLNAGVRESGYWVETHGAGNSLQAETERQESMAVLEYEVLKDSGASAFELAAKRAEMAGRQLLKRLWD